MDKQYLLDLLSQAREKLSPTEAKVIALRFPKNGEGPRRTLKEAAEELAAGGMGVTRQRIQQIEAAALAKMMGFMRSQGITQEAFAEMVA